MLDFEKAPFLELNNYRIPKNGDFIYVRMKDNKKIRLAYWKVINDHKNSAGTILLQHGHNEFIEKYYETIQELIDRNFNVVCFDWRGQGMSDRMIDNQNKQYIEDFSIHMSDLNYIINEIIKKHFPSPLFGIGHSMGGHLLLLHQEINQNNFKSIVLSAPMLGFKYEKFLFIIAFLSKFFLNKDGYFPFSRPNLGNETPFDENDLTSDYDRYTRTQRLVRKKPNIRLWGVTNAWVNAAKKSLKKIRKKEWCENIKTPIIIINPLNDKVVYSKKTQNLAKKLNNCEIFNFDKIEHEILMEKDEYRKNFWNIFDKLIN